LGDPSTAAKALHLDGGPEAPRRESLLPLDQKVALLAGVVSDLGNPLEKWGKHGEHRKKIEKTIAKP